MKELVSEIEIEAPAAKVWQILTDFRKYSEWNPFITQINGELKKGAKLEVHLQPPNEKKEMVFNPTILNIEENKELRWLGKGGAGMFNGEHRFFIKPLLVADDHEDEKEKVQFIQSEKFTGMLVSLMGKRIDTNTRKGFEEMNIALKDRAEKV